MTILLLKLTITPAVIVAATLAARRFGPAVGGWLIGLPVTAGPVVLFLALDHGAVFARHVALGIVAGVSGLVAFVFGYVVVALRGGGWPASLAVATAAFALTGLVFDVAKPPLAVLLVCGLALLVAGLRLVPAGAPGRVQTPAPWDLPVRMVLATCLVLAITGFASQLGPTLSGIVTAYPLLSTLLAVFADYAGGGAAAVAVYRGLIVGLFATMGFACTLALVLSRIPIAAAFTLAFVLTLSIQVGSLRVLRRGSPIGATA